MAEHRLPNPIDPAQLVDVNQLRADIAAEQSGDAAGRFRRALQRSRTSAIGDAFRGSRGTAPSRARRVAPPTAGELRIAAAVLPNPSGRRGPFTKSQRREVKNLRAALGRKAGGSL